jgi:hypothetical protein
MGVYKNLKNNRYNIIKNNYGSSAGSGTGSGTAAGFLENRVSTINDITNSAEDITTLGLTGTDVLSLYGNLQDQITVILNAISADFEEVNSILSVLQGNIGETTIDDPSPVTIGMTISALQGVEYEQNVTVEEYLVIIESLQGIIQ